MHTTVCRLTIPSAL